MAKDDPQFNLRIPADLKSKLDAAAVDNDRSLTGEINFRLEMSFIDQSNYSEADALNEIIDRANYLLRQLKK